MIPLWFVALFVFGTNFTLWGVIGLARLLEERVVLPRRSGQAPAPADPVTVDQVAVLIPAHNESVVIQDSLRSIMALVPRRNIHVVSDASTDDTVALAQALHVRVTSTRTNVGKAGALWEGIRRFKLVRHFRVVMLLDADTRVEPGYFEAALPLFDDPTVVAVAGCVRTPQEGRGLSAVGSVLVAHRQRIYAVAQRALKFGQTWPRCNATHIVPGFASLYRTEVLPRIDINPPGLVIEDFNMTFEIYQKRLGKVAFSLGAVAVTQDPDNLPDYLRQTRRWSLGLWQTVRRHRPRANLFTAMLTLLLLELVTSSVVFVLLPLVALVLVVPDVVAPALSWAPFGAVHAVVAAHINLSIILIGVVLPDYLLTVVVTVLDRNPRYLLCGPFFLLLRVVDAALGLYTVGLAMLTTSTGRWTSPARRVAHDTRPTMRTPDPARIG